MYTIFLHLCRHSWVHEIFNNRNRVSYTAVSIDPRCCTSFEEDNNRAVVVVSSQPYNPRPSLVKVYFSSLDATSFLKNRTVYGRLIRPYYFLTNYEGTYPSAEVTKTKYHFKLYFLQFKKTKLLIESLITGRIY